MVRVDNHVPACQVLVEVNGPKNDSKTFSVQLRIVPFGWPYSSGRKSNGGFLALTVFLGKNCANAIRRSVAGEDQWFR